MGSDKELAGREPHSACSELADDSLWGEAAAFSQYVFTEEVRRQERWRRGENKPLLRPEACQSGSPEMMVSQSGRDDWPWRKVGVNGTITLLTSQPTSKGFTELSVGLLISYSHPPQP